MGRQTFAGLASNKNNLREAFKGTLLTACARTREVPCARRFAFCHSTQSGCGDVTRPQSSKWSRRDASPTAIAEPAKAKVILSARNETGVLLTKL